MTILSTIEKCSICRSKKVEGEVCSECGALDKYIPIEEEMFQVWGSEVYHSSKDITYKPVIRIKESNYYPDQSCETPKFGDIWRIKGMSIDGYVVGELVKNPDYEMLESLNFNKKSLYRMEPSIIDSFPPILSMPKIKSKESLICEYNFLVPILQISNFYKGLAVHEFVETIPAILHFKIDSLNMIEYSIITQRETIPRVDHPELNEWIAEQKRSLNFVRNFDYMLDDPLDLTTFMRHIRHTLLFYVFRFPTYLLKKLRLPQLMVPLQRYKKPIPREVFDTPTWDITFSRHMTTTTDAVPMNSIYDSNAGVYNDSSADPFTTNATTNPPTQNTMNKTFVKKYVDNLEKMQKQSLKIIEDKNKVIIDSWLEKNFKTLTRLYFYYHQIPEFIPVLSTDVEKFAFELLDFFDQVIDSRFYVVGQEELIEKISKRSV